MQEGYIVNLSDDEGNDFNLEVVGEVEYNEDSFVVFLPADLDENDPDYGYVILRSVEDGDELNFESVDSDELLEKVYAIFLEGLQNDNEDTHGD